MRPMFFLLALAALAAGCASAAQQGAPVRERDVLTAEELASAPVLTAYEAIQRLRPSFLRRRGPTSLRRGESALPVVYVDDVRMGGVETLRTIPVGDVEEIRYLNAGDATTRFGTGHSAGVILVTTRRGGSGAA